MKNVNKNIYGYYLLLIFLYSCNTIGLSHNNSYDYVIKDLYLDRKVDYPGPDNLVIEIKVFNKKVLESIKQGNINAFRLKTSITNEKEHVFIKYMNSNICKIIYATSYFIENNSNTILKKLDYEIFFNDQLIKRKDL
ncbi:MAG: hypothetical protein CVU00_04065 [Bacteroidetes bacterium HGW-Bacteroidetes-17]|jgi:hypothetical protein|nr:MAG: hypothetical protein CVU00_04065 [Bacteroidetes bacterium HGW-Bacteroidetes-17]